MDVITGLREIWAQNLIMAPTDMSNAAVELLKGDSLTSYEAAMEDDRTNPDDETLMVPTTIKHIDPKKPKGLEFYLFSVLCLSRTLSPIL
jgi:hypothetical protein